MATIVWIAIVLINDKYSKWQMFAQRLSKVEMCSIKAKLLYNANIYYIYYIMLKYPRFLVVTNSAHYDCSLNL